MDRIGLAVLIGCHLALWIYQTYAYRNRASWHYITSNITLVIKDLVLTPILIGVVIVYLINPNQALLVCIEFPASIKIAGFAFMLLSVSLKVWSYTTLANSWSVGTISAEGNSVETHGPYLWVRHPVYVSYLLGSCGILLLTGSILLSVLGISYFTLNVIRAKGEEASLLGALGDDYLQYQQKVGGFIPLSVQRAVIGIWLATALVGFIANVLWHLAEFAVALQDFWLWIF